MSPPLPPLSPPLALLHISLGTSKVLVCYFQVGSLWGFSGVSVGALENCVYLSFAEPFLQSNALQNVPERRAAVC